MNKYGSERYLDSQFTLLIKEVETQQQWLNVYMDLIFAEGSVKPEELQDPSLLVIATHDGDIIQIVLLEEDCDSEFFCFLPEKRNLSEAFFFEHWNTINRK